MPSIGVAREWFTGSVSVNSQDFYAVYFVLVAYFHGSDNLMNL